MSNMQQDAEIARRRKLLFHATHRGTREMDTLIGEYVKKHIPHMTLEDIEQVEALLNYPDAVLMACFFEDFVLENLPLMQLIAKMKREYKNP